MNTRNGRRDVEREGENKRREGGERGSVEATEAKHPPFVTLRVPPPSPPPRNAVLLHRERDENQIGLVCLFPLRAASLARWCRSINFTTTGKTFDKCCRAKMSLSPTPPPMHAAAATTITVNHFHCRFHVTSAATLPASHQECTHTGMGGVHLNASFLPAEQEAEEEDMEGKHAWQRYRVVS